MYKLLCKTFSRSSIYLIQNSLYRNGGERGIRTPDTLSGTSVFKTDAINHSASSPLYPKYHPWKNQAVRVPTVFLLQPRICRARLDRGRRPYLLLQPLPPNRSRYCPPSPPSLENR